MKKKIVAVLLGVGVMVVSGLLMDSHLHSVNHHADGKVAINLIGPRPMKVEDEGMDVATNLIGPKPMNQPVDQKVIG